MLAKQDAVQIRTAGEIVYELSFKKVKRFNLRVRPDGTVAVSVPRRTGVGAVDLFVSTHAEWIEAARKHFAEKPVVQDSHSDDACFAVFTPVFDRLFPLVAYAVSKKPVLKVRFMKSRWGVCHVSRNYITLNKQLMDKPYEALEYVVLHELVHLIYPNHQAGFHHEMKRLMPDYLKRRALLRVK